MYHSGSKRLNLQVQIFKIMIQTKLRFILQALLCIVLCAGCEKNNNTPPRHPELGTEQKDPIRRTVISEDGPQKGERHRSSTNFSTIGMNKGKILWSCDDGITFDVNIDKSGSDDVFASSLFNTAITDFYESDHLYIANPNGASDDFTITYEIIEELPGYVYVTSSSSPLDGQKNRSSQNFNLGSSNYYEVVCKDSISFKINQDVSGSDEGIYSNLKNGSIIRNPLRSDLYIANPSGATNAFMVTFVPREADYAWMTQLSDDLYLYELSIPGTHDAGTGQSVPPGLGKCQNFGIRQQLEDGIRYFDIRVDEEMDIRHNSVDCQIDFADVWNDFTSYLKEHPGETIIMQLNSHDDDDKIITSLSPYLDSDDALTVNSIPTLGEARGKVVLFRRFREGHDAVNVRDIWPDDGVAAHVSNGYNTFYIEDRYYDAGEAIHDTKEKKNLVSAAITDACDNQNNQTMYIIFNSVAGRPVHTPWDYAWGGIDINPEMNPALSSILDTVEKSYQTPVHIGVVLMDFYNKHAYDDPHHLVERIINLNFEEPFINID